jgi:hypothetical protein
MANTPTPNKNFLEPANGDANWDVPLNANFTAIDQAFGSSFPIAVGTGGTQTLTSATSPSGVVYWYTAQQLTITASGNLTQNVIVTFPSSIDVSGNMGGSWIVSNNITGTQQANFTVTIKGASGTGVTVNPGQTITVFFNGTNVYNAATNPVLSARQTVATTATITSSIFNGLLILTGASAYTVTLPTPSGVNGATFTIYNAATATITLSTPSGVFTGPSSSAASTQDLLNKGSNSYFNLVSDGTNWYVFGELVTNQGGGLTPRSNSQTTTSSLSWNSDSYDQYSLTAQGSILTVSADAGSPTNGQKMIFRITGTATAYAITWTTGTSKSFQAVGTVLPTTTVASKIIYVGCIYNSTAARWDAVAVNIQA